MSKKETLVYTADQHHLHTCNLRIQGIKTQIVTGFVTDNSLALLEIARLEAAHDEIIARMSDADYKAFDAHENRVLTPAERASEAKQILENMSANRDKPSI
jgi:hypothetical protein